MDAGVQQEIADALKFAKDSPNPDPATAMEYNYA
jgi:TPP-dependent pyruvate/acetoin dehydrogenase alpha subunit